MTTMDDLLRLKQAQIDCLQKEVFKCQSEIEELKAKIEVERQNNLMGA